MLYRNSFTCIISSIQYATVFRGVMEIGKENRKIKIANQCRTLSKIDGKTWKSKIHKKKGPERPKKGPKSPGIVKEDQKRGGERHKRPRKLVKVQTYWRTYGKSRKIDRFYANNRELTRKNSVSDTIQTNPKKTNINSIDKIAFNPISFI